MIAVIVIALGIGVFLFTRMDDEIRRQVQYTLAEQFPHLNVSVGGARLVEGRGVAIYDLTISETSSTHLQNNLLVIDEVMVVCDVRLTKLVNGLPEVQRVVVRRPQMWASRLEDGRWNLESLWPLPSCSKKRPQIDIQNAQLAINDTAHPELPSLLLRDINLTLLPSKPSLASSSTTPGGQNSAVANASCQPFEIQGNLGGPNLHAAKIKASFNPSTKLIRAEGSVEQLQISEDLLAWVATYSPSQIRQTSVQGLLNGNFAVEHQFAPQHTPQIFAQLQLSGGRVDDSRLPWPVKELSCQILCENETLKIEQLQANVGTASLALQLERHGWSATAPLGMGILVKQVPLSPELYDVLPALLKREWNKYQPTGIVDANLQVTFDGKKWKPTATLTGHNLAFESDKFRYRLNNGSGTLQFRPAEANQQAQLDINLVGYGGGQPLEIVGQVLDPKPGAVGWVNITGQNVAIESQMIAALPDKTRQVIESLHPEGKFNVAWRLERTQLGQAKPATALRLDLVDCQVKYDKFPYPLDEIYGVIEAKNQDWTFRDLASGGSRRVFCEGYLRPVDVGKELWLNLTGEKIPLDQELLQALSPAVQQAWLQLNPRGIVNLNATVLNRTGFEKPSIGVSVKPQAVVVKPIFFPYLMEEVAGKFDYQDGHLTLTQMSARHRRTTIRSNGSGNFRPDGSWDVELAGLSVDRLEPRYDYELLAALPPKLRKLIEQMRPEGNFSMNNTTLNFTKSSGLQPTIHSKWDAQLNCFRANVQAGIELKNIHGSIRLQGENTERGSFTAGEFALDTVTFQDVQFTNVRGPLWADEQRCLLGSWAMQRQQLPSRSLSAQVYDGTIRSDAWVLFEGVPRYSATASLENANLRRIVRERFQGEQDFTGRVAANIVLEGSGKSQDTMVGTGNVSVTEANIYELPILVGLLKVLRNETPNSTAFNEADVRFRIDGRHIILNQLDFLGDAVSLLGQGETDFDQNLKLVFHSVVGRNEIRLPLVKGFVNQLGQQTMQMYVDGTVSNPNVHTQAFPGINNLLQQIQADFDTTGTTTPTREAKRRIPWLPGWDKQ